MWEWFCWKRPTLISCAILAVSKILSFFSIHFFSLMPTVFSFCVNFSFCILHQHLFLRWRCSYVYFLSFCYKPVSLTYLSFLFSAIKLWYYSSDFLLHHFLLSNVVKPQIIILLSKVGLCWSSDKFCQNPMSYPSGSAIRSLNNWLRNYSFGEEGWGRVQKPL